MTIHPDAGRKHGAGRCSSDGRVFGARPRFTWTCISSTGDPGNDLALNTALPSTAGLTVAPPCVA